MKFFKQEGNFNGKYIIREILLIFIAISLAVWFNNWNSSIKTTRAVNIAVEHIMEEISNNIASLSDAQKINQHALDAYNEYKVISKDNSNELVATPEQIASLKNLYPAFFNVTDSLQLPSGLYFYSGTHLINLEIPDLTQIAWETTRNIGVTNELNYTCLYDLESMYNLQHRFQIEIDKAADALQRREIKELMNILGFVEQLNLQLNLDYDNVLQSIETCR